MLRCFGHKRKYPSFWAGLLVLRIFLLLFAQSLLGLGVRIANPRTGSDDRGWVPMLYLCANGTRKKAPFVRRMKDVLDLNAEPYKLWQPLICFGERLCRCWRRNALLGNIAVTMPRKCRLVD